MTEQQPDFKAEALAIIQDCWSNNSKHRTAEGCQQFIEASAAVLANWMATAAQEQRNVQYYRGQCLEITDKLFGDFRERMFKKDDGTVSEDPLLAKLPEVVNEMSARCHSLHRLNDQLLEMLGPQLRSHEIPARVAQLKLNVAKLQACVVDAAKELGLPESSITEAAYALSPTISQSNQFVKEASAFIVKTAELLKLDGNRVDVRAAITDKIEDGIAETAKARRYDEFFSECIKLLDLKPGVDVPASIKQALKYGIEISDHVLSESPLPTAEENPDGLHQRYRVTRLDGTPTDPEAVYFVLRVDPDKEAVSENRIASRYAAMLYAYIIKRNGTASLEGVADDLIDLIDIDLRHFEQMVATSVISFLARELTFGFMNHDERRDLMKRANAWNVLMNSLGF